MDFSKSVARCNHILLYTRTVANSNHEDPEMNALALTRPAAQSNDAPPAQQPRPEDCTADRQTGQSEADRVFEARLRWFLEVSCNA